MIGKNSIKQQPIIVNKGIHTRSIGDQSKEK